MSKQRHRQLSQGGTTPETTPETGSGVAQFSVSEVAQFSMSVDNAIQYPAQGSPQAAQKVVDALQAAGLPVRTDAQRGLDHGTWVPLRYLFPAAGMPIVPLSIQHPGGPEDAFRVGQAPAPLTGQGWLIVASGNITHNLREWQQAEMGASIDTSYAQRFSDWIHEQLTARDVDALLDYRQRHSDALRAQPRDEHLLPLFTALGAAGAGAQPKAFHRVVTDHVIAMDSYAFDQRDNVIPTLG